MLARSVVVVGVCANATLVSSAVPIKPAVMFFANIVDSPLIIRYRGKPANPGTVPAGTGTIYQASLEPAPIWPYVIIAMQRFFLGTIAPVEILVGAERRRASQLFV